MTSFRLNRSDLQLIGVFLGASVIWLSFRYHVENYTYLGIVSGLTGYVVKTASLIFIISWAIQKFLVSTKNYAMFLFSVFAVLVLIGFLDLLRDYVTADPKWEWDMGWDTTIVRSLYNSAPDVALPLGLILGRKYYGNKLELAQLQSAQRELELKLLRSQFDPHFLYNNLNTLDALVDHAPRKKIKEHISNLASLYRYLVHSREGDIAPLGDEMALARNYAHLIGARFGNDYQFEIIGHEARTGHYLPKGAMLTVLENVVKHNSALDGTTVWVKVIVGKESIKITNKLSDRNGTRETTTGTGLRNLDKSYRLLSDRKIEIYESEHSFAITLPLLNLLN